MVAFPDLDVRREMLKLEIAADLANLQAEADSILSDAAAQGRVLNIPPDLAGRQRGLTPIGADGEGEEAAELVEPVDSIESVDSAADPGADPPA